MSGSPKVVRLNMSHDAVVAINAAHARLVELEGQLAKAYARIAELNAALEAVRCYGTEPIFVFTHESGPATPQ